MMTKYYGVVTRTGSDVFTSWEDVTAFLKEHPGQEFHKRFPTSGEAWDFVEKKQVELGLKSVSKTPVHTHEEATAGEPMGCIPAASEDDAPPWD